MFYHFFIEQPYSNSILKKIIIYFWHIFSYLKTITVISVYEGNLISLKSLLSLLNPVFLICFTANGSLLFWLDKKYLLFLMNMNMGTSDVQYERHLFLSVYLRIGADEHLQVFYCLLSLSWTGLSELPCLLNLI